MPEEDGFSLLRKVRAQGDRTPAIALTAYTRPSDRTRALQAGFQTHLSKPFDPDRLLEVLRRSRSGVAPEAPAEREAPAS